MALIHTPQSLRTVIMPSPIEYATYIIDLTHAMMEQHSGLNADQFHRIGLVNHHAVDFITKFMQKENISAPALLQYLTEDAQEPLRSIRGNCKKMLAGQYGEFEADYNEAIQEIYDCVLEMVEDIRQLCHDLKHFMASMGMED
jgi:hypothetical protein